MLLGDALFPNTASKSTAMATVAGGGTDWFSIPGEDRQTPAVTAPVHNQREGLAVRPPPDWGGFTAEQCPMVLMGDPAVTREPLKEQVPLQRFTAKRIQHKHTHTHTLC